MTGTSSKTRFINNASFLFFTGRNAFEAMKVFYRLIPLSALHAVRCYQSWVSSARSQTSGQLCVIMKIHRNNAGNSLSTAFITYLQGTLIRYLFLNGTFGGVERRVCWISSARSLRLFGADHAGIIFMWRKKDWKKGNEKWWWWGSESKLTHSSAE